MRPGSLLGPDELRRDPYIRAAEEAAAAGGFGPLYLVGGYLRDLLLGRTSAARIDLDLVIWGEPQAFGRAVAKTFDGTLLPIDLETVRVLGRRAGTLVRVDIARPKGGTIELDLAARDFTVNALAVRIDRLGSDTTAVIVDPSGGREDLRRGCLRALSPSALDRDPLRLFRAVRLAGELAFTIEEGTRHAIIERASLLAAVAGERLRDEVFRVLGMLHAAPSIECLDTLRLLGVLVPEVEALKSVPASPPHRLPLWEHSMETLRSVELLLSHLGRFFPEDAPWLRDRLDREIEAGVTEAAILKLMGLLHDLGKPQTRSIHPNGRVRFLGHEEAGLPILERLCERLRLGRQATTLIGQIERHHLRPLHLSREAAVSAGAKYRLFRELGDAAPGVLLHSWADLRATIGEDAEEFSRHQILVGELFRFYRGEYLGSQATPLVRGDHLMQTFGVPPGPFLGMVLDRLREAQATGLIMSREEGLVYVQQHLDSWRRAFEESPASRSPARGEID
jgi:putative nucleotidyltransferase with HDIG domain